MFRYAMLAAFPAFFLATAALARAGEVDLVKVALDGASSESRVCAACHLTGEATQKTSACDKNGVVRAVSAQACAQCHPGQAEQFAHSKHAAAWVAMEAMPTTTKTSPTPSWTA